MRTPYRYKKLDGKIVRLTRTVTTRGGRVFNKGRKMLVRSIWAARFNLEGLRKEKSVIGTMFIPRVNSVSRLDFEVVS